MKALRLEKVTVRYGAVTALDGIDLTIETGKGSGVSALKVGSGGSPFGIADLATMLVARSKGADDVAVMSIYANTGQTFYWLKSYGVNGVKDFRVFWSRAAADANLATADGKQL